MEGKHDLQRMADCDYSTKPYEVEWYDDISSDDRFDWTMNQSGKYWSAVIGTDEDGQERIVAVIFGEKRADDFAAYLNDHRESE